VNKKMIRCAALAGAALATTAAWTQEIHSDVATGSLSVRMIAEGSVDPKPVAGAPYSADQTTITTQTLADGNRIVHSSSTKVYRDQQGRTRFEHSLGNIGALSTGQPHTMIMISDPVAGERYNLQPESHTAQKMPFGPGQANKVWFESSSAAKTAPGLTAGISATPMPTTIMSYRVDSDQSLKKNSEDLGTQSMQGVQAHGTRTTTIIPAGAEGNEQPMEIVDERWYSAELQTNIKTVHTDPRMGETVFTLANLSRSNPDPSLFQIPADYQVLDHPQLDKVMMIPAPAPPPPAQ
jgi:hypothetical protein